MTTTPNVCEGCGRPLSQYLRHTPTGETHGLYCGRCLGVMAGLLSAGDPDLEPGSGGSILHGPTPLCECGGWHRLEECGAYKLDGAA